MRLYVRQEAIFDSQPSKTVSIISPFRVMIRYGLEHLQQFYPKPQFILDYLEKNS